MSLFSELGVLSNKRIILGRISSTKPIRYLAFIIQIPNSAIISCRCGKTVLSLSCQIVSILIRNIQMLDFMTCCTTI
jgi:hypothetical protein